mmetsp:Transcript_62592/g.149257  ORF Transcript_62592/g.149257 Transcript_62592/m.149257 type:complete len:347 (+) Transcript_62592:281-1321(+)
MFKSRVQVMQRTSVDVLAEAKHSNLAKRSCGILQGVHHDRKTRLHVQDHRVFGLSILLLACHGLVDLCVEIMHSVQFQQAPQLAELGEGLLHLLQCFLLVLLQQRNDQLERGVAGLKQIVLHLQEAAVPVHDAVHFLVGQIRGLIVDQVLLSLMFCQILSNGGRLLRNLFRGPGACTCDQDSHFGKGKLQLSQNVTVKLVLEGQAQARCHFECRRSLRMVVVATGHDAPCLLVLLLHLFIITIEEIFIRILDRVQQFLQLIHSQITRRLVQKNSLNQHADQHSHRGLRDDLVITAHVVVELTARAAGNHQWISAKATKCTAHEAPRLGGVVDVGKGEEVQPHQTRL